MKQLQTSVTLTTASHRIVGRIVNAGQRLHDILNNKLSTCLNLYDVNLFRPTDGATPFASFPFVTMPKALINLVLIQEQQHEAPAKRLYGYVQKDTHQTWLAVAGYEVKGYLHFISIPKPELFLTDTITSFVPVTQATVTCVADSARTWQAPVVFVQRCSIILFHLEMHH